ncbi:MAG: hypothetical protein K0R20_96 [Actinomycetia bacterium]|nr:hypothetical protein [Actinomycetes bacterium]
MIAKDDAYETLAGDRLGFVGRLGTPLFFEDFGFASLVFFVLADGIECELFFGSEERLEELSHFKAPGVAEANQAMYPVALEAVMVSLDDLVDSR